MRLAERLGTTIAAPATAPGSTIGILRISGPQSAAILRELTGRAAPRPRHATVSTLCLGNNFSPEQALVLFFAAPASYTGEDMAELQIHGAGGNLNELRDHLHTLGALPALPGEFSFRAVVNGKLSLAQAAALPDLILTQDRLQADFARRAAFLGHFEQTLAPLLAKWDEFETLAIAVIDFPDQVAEHLSCDRLSTLIVDSTAIIAPALENTRRLASAAALRVVIVGRPNVGKSSLFNKLVGHERALVAPEPGTTRDYLVETTLFDALRVDLCDTAGLRSSENAVELAGISRTLTLTEVSTHIIFLFDGSIAPTAEDHAALDTVAARGPLIVANKSDLGIHPQAAGMRPHLHLSARTGAQVPELVNFIATRIATQLPDPTLPVLFHEERRRSAERFLAAAEELRLLLPDGEIALIAAAVSRCRSLLGELVGRVDDLSLYDRIFSSFCIGK